MITLKKEDFPLIPTGTGDDCRLASTCNNRGDIDYCGTCMYNPSACAQDHYSGKYDNSEEYDLDDLIES